jgi:hypothetical protein
MRIKKELQWAKEMKVITDRHAGKPCYIDGIEEIIVAKCCYDGFPHLTEMTSEELDEHIQRLEWDINSTHKV